MKDLNLVIEGQNNLKCLLSVKMPADDPKYSKFGKDFFDDEYINDEVFKYFDRYYMSLSDEFTAWYQQNEEEAWFDLRLGDDGKMYAVAGDSEGIKFLNEVIYITLDYLDHEINFMGSEKDSSYWFSFWIDPDGGILKAADCSRSFDFYDDLNNDDAYYSIKEYSFKAALDDLIAHSDDYQNPDNEDEEEEEEE